MIITILFMRCLKYLAIADHHTRRGDEETPMYSKDGESYFVVDAHIALWDARPENQRNVHGRQFIDCFYDYHRNLSPESEVWPYEDYLY